MDYGYLYMNYRDLQEREDELISRMDDKAGEYGHLMGRAEYLDYLIEDYHQELRGVQMRIEQIEQEVMIYENC